MALEKTITSPEEVEKTILILRGQKIMLDLDLARLYGVSTKKLNQQVKRNRDRFPKDFMFRLTAAEKAEVVTNCDHLGKLKFSPYLPYAFTEHGTVMLASVLNSSRAVQANIFVVRAFVRLRKAMILHGEIAAKLKELETRCDLRHRSVLEAIRQLLESPEEPERPAIGFRPKQSQ